MGNSDGTPALLRAGGPDLGTVRVADVEQELARLWQMAAEGEQEGHQTTRTLLLNLVVSCREEVAASRISALIAAVTVDHPSRNIIVRTVEGRTDGDIRATVSVACQLVSRSRRQVCCEQIMIEAGDGDLDGVIGAVLPLTLPDVPLVLWLEDEGFGDAEVLERLLTAADRVIVDSGQTADLRACIRWTSAQALQSAPAVIDLNWLRLGRIRMALAQQFDSERWRRHLTDVDEVEVVYEAGPMASPSAEALLLAGWIVSRLRWRAMSLQSDVGGAVSFGDSGGRRLTLRPESGGGSGAVKRTMLGAGGDVRFRAFFSESPKEAGLWVEAQGEEVEQTAAYAPVLSPEQVLCGALEITSTDAIYADALAVAEALGEQVTRKPRR